MLVFDTYARMHHYCICITPYNSNFIPQKILYYVNNIQTNNTVFILRNSYNVLRYPNFIAINFVKTTIL